jgi:hypothetical protein
VFDARRSTLAPVLGHRAARTLLVTVVVVVWGLITHGTHAGSGDELHYLMMARSIAFDRDVLLANDYDDPRNLVGGGIAKAEAHVRPGRDGVPRPVHDIGLPLIAAPLVRVMYPLAEWLNQRVPGEWMTRARLNASLLLRHQVSLAMAIMAGLLAIEIARVLLGIGLVERSAVWWALLFALSPPLLSFSFLFFTELVAGLIVMVSLRRILQVSPPASEWLFTGLLVGLLTLIHIRNGPLSLALAAVAVTSHWRRLRVLVPFALGIFVVASVRTAVNWHFWGQLFLNDHARLGSYTGLGDMFREIGFRLSGLLFDQEFGLLTLAPIYFLAWPGLVSLWRRNRALAMPVVVLIAAGIGSIVMPVINPYGFVGGWSPAPRFIVPIVPLLAVAAAGAAREMAGVRAAFVAVLIALQILISVVVWNDPKILWEDCNGISALSQVVPQLTSVFARLPTWHLSDATVWPFVFAFMLWTVVTAWLLGGVPKPVSASTSNVR